MTAITVVALSQSLFRENNFFWIQTESLNNCSSFFYNEKCDSSLDASMVCGALGFCWIHDGSGFWCVDVCHGRGGYFGEMDILDFFCSLFYRFRNTGSGLSASCSLALLDWTEE